MVASAAAAVGRARGPGAVAEAVVDQALVLGAEAAHLLLTGPDGMLGLAAHRNLPSVLLERAASVGEEDSLLAARAAQSGEVSAVSVEEAREQGLQFACDFMEQTGTRCLLSVPLRDAGERIGVLTLATAEPLGMGEPELSALRALAQMFASAIANAQHVLRLRAVFENSFEFLGLLAPDGTVLEANRTALEFAGQQRDEVVGRPFWEGSWWPPEQLGRLRELIGAAAAGEFVRVEVEHSGRDGHRIWVDFSLSPVCDDQGRVVLLVPEGRDITDRKRFELMREEWSSIVAHDLQQPMNTLRLSAQQLHRRVDTLGEGAVGPARRIDASVKQLERMTRDLLDLTRAEAGRLRLDVEPTVVKALVEEVVDQHEADDGMPPLKLTVESEPPTARLDRGRIAQVLGNLLSNAAKYGDPDGPVQLVLREHDGNVRLTVSSKGDPIGNDELPRLFERLYRSKEARGSAVPGSGLGLYIARHIVELHGGRIWAESEGDQTAFHVLLPAMEGGAG